MRLHPDQALKNLNELSKQRLPDLSESDTRSKIVDSIFTQCLNWQEEDITREEHAESGFVDYLFGIGEKNIFVVEAKRQGFSFKLPITFGFARQYKINGILPKDKNVKEAIKQARGYCFDKGVRYGVITNGDQFIIFEAYRIGEDWEKGNCLVFYNMDDIKRNFTDFWNILSKDAVERGSLVDYLSKEVEELRFTRPVDNIHFRNEIQPRNELHRYMLPIIEHAFREITEDNKREMLNKCYVLEHEFEEMGESLKSHFSDDLRDLDFKKIKQGEETAGIFQADFYKYAELLERAPPEPIIFLLLGGVGSGKTTFIFRFFNVVLTEDEQKKITWFYIDFKDAPKDEKGIRDFILRKILEEFNLKYKDLLQKILALLKIEKVTYSLEDIAKLFLVLKYEGHIPSLVVDNVDQHKVESSTFHEKVFLEANSLTKELRTITIMTLREESFYRSAIDGVFTAYYIERYEISPPDLRSMLLKRLTYMLEKLKLPQSQFQELLQTNLDFQRQQRTLQDFLKIVKDTLYQSANRSVSRLIARASGGDMRRSLEFFSSFLVSGNTKIMEILDTYYREGSYTIAEHQFVKSIVLGNHRYYSEDVSYLMNIFDFNTEYSKSHFLKLRILKYAEDGITNSSPYGRGYLSVNGLVEEANKISVSREAVEDSLVKLAKYGLILLNTRSKTDLQNASHFKITECGTYYLNILLKRFSYIDLVLADTPIADVDLVERIRHMLPDTDLNVRFERASLFINYLERMEKREHDLHPEYRFSPLGEHKFAPKIADSFQKEKVYIKKRIAEKGYFQFEASPD